MGAAVVLLTPIEVLLAQAGTGGETARATREGTRLDKNRIPIDVRVRKRGAFFRRGMIPPKCFEDLLARTIDP